MNTEPVRKLIDDTMVALESVLREAEQKIAEAKSHQVGIDEAQRRLDERKAIINKEEQAIVDEKRYLVAIRKKQEQKDIEQITFTAKKEVIDKGMFDLQEKQNQITLAMEGLDRKKAEIAKAQEALDGRKKEFEELETQRQILLLKEEDLKKREEADVERKRILDFKAREIATREARIQKYANLK